MPSDLALVIVGVAGPLLGSAATIAVAWFARPAPHAPKAETQALPPLPSARTTYTSLPGVLDARPRILVVDDEGSYGDILVRLAKTHGLEADAALSADEARAFWRSRGYAGILLDLVFPGGSGVDLATEFRPIVIILSGASRKQLDAVRSLGIAHYVIEKGPEAFAQLDVAFADIAKRYPPPP